MDEFEVSVTHRFAAFCKKVLKLSAYKWYDKRRRFEEREISLSLIYEEFDVDFQDPRDYFETSWHFEVFGMEVSIPDERVAGAISHLDKHLQDVILLYYFLDFKHREIAELCGCDIRTVNRRKQKALGLLQKELGDKYE